MKAAGSTIPLSDFDREIVERITAAGGRVYLVGGVLRDLLLGREPQDRDYCVTGLTGEEFQNLFPQAALVGKDFPVFILKGDTYALARREKKTAKGYRGFEIFSSPQVSIEEDLKRRDLTVNAMALDLSTGQLIDPYGGLEDLRRGILRAVSPAFAEDPLRVYRTARLAAHLGFRVDPSTLKLMGELKGELPYLSPERVGEELKKALASPQPSRFFQVLGLAGVMDVHFPELTALGELPPPFPGWDSALVYTLDLLDRVAFLTPEGPLRFAALVHALEDGGASLSQRLRLPRRFSSLGKAMAQELPRVLKLEVLPERQGVILLQNLAKIPSGMEAASILLQALSLATGDPSLLALKDKLKRWSREVLALTGKDIEAPPGPLFGEKLLQARMERLRSLRRG